MTREPPTANWFGDGPAPWDAWPGVSLRLDATWSDERARWESPCGKYWFDADEAQRVIDFFPAYLRLTKGEHAGKPFELLDYHRDLIVRVVFGWKRVADGARQFRKVFHEVGKKSAKSTFASGIGLYLAFADGEMGSEVYAAAGDKDQARVVFAESATMARESGEFLRDAGVVVLRNALVQQATNSTYKALSSTVGTKHGLNLHGLIFDEFHTQRTRELYDTLYKGTSARRQPVVVIITTAGDDRESICYEEYEYAKQVLAGVIVDEQYLPVIFEASPEDDFTLESTWRKANPGLGVTKKLDYMVNECAAAQAEPRKRNSFLRLELSIWTESRTVWIAPESWAACRREEPPTDLDDLVCCAGVDLSSSSDLTAIVVALRRQDERPVQEVQVDTYVPYGPSRRAAEGDAAAARTRVLTVDYAVELVPYFFIPREILRRRVREDRVPYDLWAEEGRLRVTDGNVVDYGEVYRVLVEEIKPRFPNLKEVGYDPWNANHLSSAALAAGVPMVEVRQGYGSLSGPSKLFEALVLSKRIIHDGNPVLAWNVANCEIVSDVNGNIRPVKPGGDSRGRRRIDGVVASVIALSRLMVAPQERRYVGNELPWIDL